MAYDIVSPTDNVSPGSHGKIAKRRVNSEPADLRQGIANAYNVVTEVGFIESRLTISVHLLTNETRWGLLNVTQTQSSYKKSQRSVESLGFSTGTLVSSYREAWQAMLGIIRAFSNWHKLLW